jgi:hypothetical protein
VCELIAKFRSMEECGVPPCWGPAYRNERLKMSRTYPQTPDNSATGFIVCPERRAIFLLFLKASQDSSERLIVHNSEPASESPLPRSATACPCGVSPRTALAVFLRWSARGLSLAEFLWLSSGPPGKYRDSFLKQATTASVYSDTIFGSSCLRRR